MPKQLQEPKQTISVSIEDLVNFKNDVVQMRSAINAQLSWLNPPVTEADAVACCEGIKQQLAKLDKYFTR